VVTEQSVQDLPLNGRNFVNLVTMQPGVNPGQSASISSGGRPDDRRANSTISANGMDDLYNNQMIEGMDNNEREQGFLGVRPSIDAIAEVKVDTNAYSAEVGRNAGAVVNIITKSGTNLFHGTAYEFLRNDATDARDVFTYAPNATLGRTGVNRPEYRQNQFGGSVGGPVIKNRTFFFGDFEDNRIIQGMPSGLLTVPTVRENPNCAGNTTGYDFTDNGGTLLTTTPDAVGKVYFGMFPCPNNGSAGALSNNYLNVAKKTQYAFSSDGRIDENFRNGDIFFGRYSYNNVNTLYPGPLPAVKVAGETVMPNGSYFAFPGPSVTKAHNAQFNYIHLISPNLILELKTGYTRIAIDSENLNAASAGDISSKIGLSNVNTSLAPTTAGLMPIRFLTGGYANPGDSPYLPILDFNNTYQYMGALTYTHGAHVFKAGVQWTARQLNYYQSAEPLGWVNFTTSSSIGNSMENLLLGQPYSYLRGNLLFKPGYRTKEPSVYLQDDWHVTHKLTLNIGIRYEIFTALNEAHNDYANFNYQKLTLITGSQSSSIGINTKYSNIAPRVGFSEAIWKGGVVRGGFGLSYYPLPYQGAIQNANPPFTAGNACTGYTCPSFWPVLPVPIASSATNLSGTLSYSTSNYNTAYVEQFNVMVQQQIGANVITVGGIGELGRHMNFQTTANLPAPNGPYLNDATQGPEATQKLTTAAALPNVSTIAEYAAEGTTNYYALQAVFARRFTKGLAFNANYTWAHGLSDALSGSGGGQLIGAVPSNPRYDYGDSNVDIRQRLALNWNYQLPFGQNAHGLKALAMKGWESNFVYAWQTGSAFTVGDGFSGNPSGHTQINLPNVSTERPDVASNAYKNSGGSITKWLNLAAWTPQQAGTAGNERDETYHGPNLRHADLSLFKNFKVYEKVSAQFRAECYNISNTPSYGTPNATISGWTAGPNHDAAHPISNPTKNPALTAVGLLPGDVPTNAGGFGTITTDVTNPRQFQFALKLLF
jgi:hypothetical protein